MHIDEDKCDEFGLDHKKVASVARRLSKAANEARDLGLTIFGGAGTGSLRYHLGGHGGVQTIVADLEGHFDGGDGGDNY